MMGGYYKSEFRRCRLRGDQAHVSFPLCLLSGGLASEILGNDKDLVHGRKLSFT